MVILIIVNKKGCTHVVYNEPYNIFGVIGSFAISFLNAFSLKNPDEQPIKQPKSNLLILIMSDNNEQYKR